MRRIAQRLAITTLPLTLLAASLSHASEISLPNTMAWTAYGTNSSGYAQAVALGNMLQSEYGTSVRVLPGDNDVSRMTPLKQGRVDLCACGISSYYGVEGVMMFAHEDWGPQPLRVITTSTASFGLSLAVAGDLEVKTPADLKGKRIAYIRGDDALNKGTEAYLAFGGLTWDDVERVDYPGYSRSFDGIIAGNVDASFTTTVTPPAQQLASSPRGISWPELDPNDTEGWERMKTVAPYFRPHEVTSGAGNVSSDNPVSSASYPYPIIVANSDIEDDVAYGLIKAMQDNYDQYKDSAPGAVGYALEYQDLQWVIPFHDAVVDYYKDIGVWTDKMQLHQEELVERQLLLLETWESFVSSAPSDEEDFKKAWMSVRANALTEAGFDPIFQ
ncbi:TAXI family TRAP transporter solute-binding subunit [Vreelandella rituensis]|uniref:C4-dicarboxylate ABC transporter substrate-binding protein n=1 Tax=Vreelandella rituensis TaxID=2282306 RepID=A0A368TWL4_9GAMM|nr:TAXI family TRAP transporter solute-binding subunit [Halomonas rituensis]RCV88332.1 C4-dicarboxylate ABC transporter substrate-binding protein [Halomonas rituensis]